MGQKWTRYKAERPLSMHERKMPRLFDAIKGRNIVLMIFLIYASV
jgi:hypothetical protein